MKPLAQNSLIQNRYLIVQLIGKGGMGEVYLAVDQRLGSAVALKRTYFAGDEMLGNAFEREARTLARMRHPVLPKVSDHFGEGDEQYLVMEHISGDDLSKRLESAQKPFPISWVLFWADQLLDALSYLHSHEPPIIHRDIKPQNLKLTDENNIILLDFGLSKTSTGMTNISQSGSTGSVVGYTPHYAPMEQIRGIGTSARSDLYSLSATLYQLLTNTIPADALSRADAMLNGSPDPVAPLDTLNPEVSRNVADVILKGMEVSQEKRFVDAREMQKVLRKAFTEMQEAMSAKTVAFSGQNVISKSEASEDLKGARASHESEKASENVEASIISEIRERAPSESPAAGIDFDATIAVEPAAAAKSPKQSEVKTEVFLPGSDAFRIPEQKPPGRSKNVLPTPVSLKIEADEAPSTAAQSSGNGAPPSETMPLIEFEPERPTEKPVPVANPLKAIPPAAKTSGKTGIIFAGLAVFFVLALAAVAGGWYIYAGYNAKTATVEPTPSPEPSLEPSPSPEATFEAAAEVNASPITNTAPDSNVDPFATANSNTSNDDLTVSPTPSPPPQQQEAPSRPQPVAPVTVRTPVTRAAPKGAAKRKTPSDRTVILQ